MDRVKRVGPVDVRIRIAQLNKTIAPYYVDVKHDAGEGYVLELFDEKHHRIMDLSPHVTQGTVCHILWAMDAWEGIREDKS